MAKYDLKQAEDGTYYFLVLADNGEIIATSETYSSKSNAERGINDFRNAVRGHEGE